MTGPATTAPSLRITEKFMGYHLLTPLKSASGTNTKSVLFTAASSQYLDLGNTSEFQPTDPFSVSGWVFVNTTGTLISTFSLPAPVNFFGYAIWTNNGNTIIFSMRDGVSNIQVVAVGVLTAGIWQHLVCTSDGSNSPAGMNVYVNATLGSVTTSGSSLVPIVYNGSTKIGGNAITGFMNGYVSDVSIWDAELNLTEITNLYNSGQPTNIVGSANLSHLYGMGNSQYDTNATIYDQVGAANGTMTAGPAIKTFAPFSTLRLATNALGNDPGMYLIEGTKIYAPNYHSNTNASPSSFQAPDLGIFTFTAPSTVSSSIGNLPTQYPPYGDGPYTLLKDGTIGYLTYYKNAGFLKVLDLSNPTVSIPVLATVTDNTISAYQTIALAKKGNYLYVPTTKFADGTGYIEIIDVSIPASANIVNTISTTISFPGNTVVISGDYLYICGTNPKGMEIYDISGANATNPLLKSAFTTTTTGVTSITLDPTGTYAYLTEFNGNNNNSYLEVVDISNVSSPSIVTTKPVVFSPIMSLVHPSRRLLFIPCWDSAEIYIFSIYDPANPLLADVLAMGNDSHAIQKNPQWLQLLGDYLYVGNSADTGVTAEFYSYLDVFQL